MKSKYFVSAITEPFGEPVDAGIRENDPEQAFIAWCSYSEKYPTCASIQPHTKEDGIECLKWVSLNFDKAEAYMDKYKCPYKKDWIKEQIESQIRGGRCSMQWEYDELFPFCVG